MAIQKYERPQATPPRLFPNPEQPETRGAVTDVIVPIVASIAGAYATHKLNQRKPKN
jgi:hypothetical protein